MLLTSWYALAVPASRMMQPRKDRIILPRSRWCRGLFMAIALISMPSAYGGPAVVPGDLALRHDIQRLADHGVLSGPVTTWPLSWGPILSDLQHFQSTAELPTDVRDALARVRARAQWQTRTDELRFKARASAAERPIRIRSFQDVPREDGEFGAGVT